MAPVFPPKPVVLPPKALAVPEVAPPVRVLVPLPVLDDPAPVVPYNGAPKPPGVLFAVLLPVETPARPW